MYWPFKFHTRYESADKNVVLRQGWNSVEKKFFIQLCYRDKDLVIRKYLDEEYFQNFHNMGRFTYRQTKKDEDTDFEDEDTPNNTDAAGLFP